MLARGVMEGGNMLPSAAYTKLIWVLGHTRNMDEVRTLMQKNMAGEITEREGPRGFMLLQGIEPGIEEILNTL
jgi:glutamyl-tRNA(Gln) amidotransferase subunit D